MEDYSGFIWVGPSIIRPNEGKGRQGWQRRYEDKSEGPVVVPRGFEGRCRP